MSDSEGWENQRRGLEMFDDQDRKQIVLSNLSDIRMEEFESLEHDADEMEGDTEASPATDGSFSSPLTHSTRAFALLGACGV